ncbi:MAG TPA: hypothetical protein VKA53_08925 [Thermoanaerobaculia bacterium]|nr:hypothetical protein [Thermoanaerobaculia bacterium]
MSRLSKEFPGKVAVKELDATTPENAPLMKKLGFENHGLVIRSPQGKVLWKEPDHEVKIEDVRAAVKKLLAP